MLDAALRIYEPAVERSLNRTRIRLYNAACAIGYLAFRAGVPPEQKCDLTADRPAPHPISGQFVR
jgi:hypothetical protein